MCTCIIDFITTVYCLDSSFGRVPACDAGDPGSIPGGGKLNAWDTVPF
jgi:hypothetical protein